VLVGCKLLVVSIYTAWRVCVVCCWCRAFHTESRVWRSITRPLGAHGWWDVHSHRAVCHGFATTRTQWRGLNRHATYLLTYFLLASFSKLASVCLCYERTDGRTARKHNVFTDTVKTDKNCYVHFVCCLCLCNETASVKALCIQAVRLSVRTSGY